MTDAAVFYRSVFVLFLAVAVSAGTFAAADSFSLVEYQNLISREPDVKGAHIKVWTIKQDAIIRINLVEISGELALHKHPDADHSLMVLEGELQVQVENQLRQVKKGDYISIPANVAHKYKNITPKVILVSMDAPYYDPAKTVPLE